jgi:hypothetical protein
MSAGSDDETSQGGEEQEQVEDTGGGGSSKEKESESEELRELEESPPEDATPKDYQHCSWFIDNGWRVVIDPPAGRKGGKMRAYVMKIQEVFSKKTTGKKDDKEEWLVYRNFRLAPERYKYWDVRGYWSENAQVRASFKKPKASCESRKSKCCYAEF